MRNRLAVATAPVLAGTTLQVTSRPTRDSARVKYSSNDALAGLDKGSGTDPSAIAVQLRIRNDGTSTRWVMPAGAFDGRVGWTHNDAGRAVFVNRDAPEGAHRPAKDDVRYGAAREVRREESR